MTDLAETIERVERGIQHWSLDGHLSKADAEALLATARRVQAMEGTVGFAKEVREHVAENGMLNARFVEQQYPLLLDLASDQSAARAEVERLRQLAQDEMRDQAVLRIQLEEQVKRLQGSDRFQWEGRRKAEARVAELADAYQRFQEEADDEGASNAAIETLLAAVEKAVKP